MQLLIVFCAIFFLFCLFVYALVNLFVVSIDTIRDFDTFALIIARESPGRNACKTRATLDNRICLGILVMLTNYIN